MEAGAGGGVLEEQLRAHSAHFAAMVELIPAKFYISREDEGAEDSKYWVNKNKKKAHKQAVKEVTKKAKRLKLDPESQKSVAELQAEANKQAEEQRTEGDSLEPRGVNGFSVEHVQSTSLNNLKDRLKEKIEGLRRKRKAPEEGEPEPRSEEIAQKRQKRMEKRQRRKELRKKKLVSGGGGGPSTANEGKSTKPEKPSFRDKETGRIVFSKFDFTTPIQGELQEKASSKKDYKKLLVKAEAAQKKLEELKKKDERRGEELEKKLKWQRALDMARGTKLHDNPKLLKKTFKRLEKKKQKSGKVWEQRKEAEQQAKEKKQQKRQRNIQERKEKVKTTKMKKRAKKGGPRKPGF